MQFESLWVHVTDCAKHLKRRHMQVLHRLNICTMFNCPVVQISALGAVFVCFIYTNEIKYKVLKYCVVVKLSRHNVPTNGFSVAMWRSLKWLLFTCETFPCSIQWKWSLVQVQILKSCDVNRNSDCDLSQGHVLHFLGIDCNNYHLNRYCKFQVSVNRSKLTNFREMSEWTLS